MKKNKPLIITVALLLVLFLLFRVLQWTYVLSAYKVTSESMMPAIELDDHFLMTKLIKPKIGDFICYRAIYEKDNQEHSFAHRLMANEFDTIEMRNGLLIRNGKYVEDSTKLIFTYKLFGKEIFKLKDILGLTNSNYDFVSDSVIYASLTYSQLGITRKYACNIETIMKRDFPDPNLYFFDKKTKWNIDNFGPIIVPEGYCFVLGDNRHNSLDSRYRGFIAKDKVKAVMFYKYRF